MQENSNNEDNGKFHPQTKIAVVSLLLGSIAGGFLIRDNLQKLGKKMEILY